MMTRTEVFDEDNGNVKVGSNFFFFGSEGFSDLTNSNTSLRCVINSSFGYM